MKTRAAFHVLLAILPASLSVFAADSPKDVPPADYFIGKYKVIGSTPDASASYSGTVELKPMSDGQFVMIRTIAGREVVKGTAVLDHADPPADHPPVLRIRFIEGGHECEGTFLWRSDLDNYPRLTGMIYRLAKSKTKTVWLEAWFSAATLEHQNVKTYGLPDP